MLATAGVVGVVVLCFAVLVVGGVAYGIVTAYSPSSGDAAIESCDTNYEGGCVPDTAVDVDCDEISATDLAVVGEDVNGLDRDGDGIACES